MTETTSAATGAGDEVICPNCTHSFGAISTNTQKELAALREKNKRLEGNVAFWTALAHDNAAAADANAADADASRQREEALKAMIDWMENMDPRLVEEARTWFGSIKHG